jgi:hypothetical protein
MRPQTSGEAYSCGNVPAEPVVELCARRRGNRGTRPGAGAGLFVFHPKWVSVHDVLPSADPGPTRRLAHAFLSSDGKVVALCIVAQVLARQETAVSLASRPADGRLIATACKVRPMPAPPDVDSLSLPGASLEQVFCAHATRVAGTRIPG